MVSAIEMVQIKCWESAEEEEALTACQWEKSRSVPGRCGVGQVEGTALAKE